jgi:hypothetical protein
MATPMVDDVQLAAVQWIREETDQAFAQQDVAGLDGTLHQKLGRRSHRVTLYGLLVSDTAADDLDKLQAKTTAGEEVSFTADITSALAVDKMVIESLTVEQQVGAPGWFSYVLVLAESPPLPPPAETSSFGGLGDFGLGDLGFDTDALGGVLSDVADQAGAITGALDGAMDAAQGLSALSGLADLANVGNPVKPLVDKVGELGGVAPAVSGAVQALGNLIG